MRIIVLDPAVPEWLKSGVGRVHSRSARVVVGMDSAAETLRAHLTGSTLSDARIAWVVSKPDLMAVSRSVPLPWVELSNSRWAMSRLRVAWFVVPGVGAGSAGDGGALTWPDLGPLAGHSACVLQEETPSRVLSPDDRVALLASGIRVFHGLPATAFEDDGWAWLREGVFSLAALRIPLDADEVAERLLAGYAVILRDAMLGPDLPEHCGSSYAAWVVADAASRGLAHPVVANDHGAIARMLDAEPGSRAEVLRRSISSSLQDWSDSLASLRRAAEADGLTAILEGWRSQPGVRAALASTRAAKQIIEAERAKIAATGSDGLEASVKTIESGLEQGLKELESLSETLAVPVRREARTNFRLAMGAGLLAVVGAVLWFALGMSLAGRVLLVSAVLLGVALAVTLARHQRRRRSALLDLGGKASELTRELESRLETVRRWALLDTGAALARSMGDRLGLALSEIERSASVVPEALDPLTTRYEVGLPDAKLPAQVLEGIPATASAACRALFDSLISMERGSAPKPFSLPQGDAVRRAVHESVRTHLQESLQPHAVELLERVRTTAPRHWQEAPVGRGEALSPPLGHQIRRFALHPAWAREFCRIAIGDTHDHVIEGEVPDFVAGVAVILEDLNEANQRPPQAPDSTTIAPRPSEPGLGPEDCSTRDITP